MLELLQEFDEMCTECGASYSLFDVNLLCAARGFGVRGCEIDVLMTLDDYRHFEAAVEKRANPNREIEGLENNPDMPGWLYRYVDSSTTLLSLDHLRVRKAHGIAVSIHIARTMRPSQPLAHIHRRMLDFLEEGMGYSIAPSYYFDPRDGRRAKLLSSYAKVFKALTGVKNHPEKLAARFYGEALVDKRDPSLTRLPRIGVTHLDPGFLQDLQEGVLSKVKLSCSAHMPNYLAQRFGAAWQGMPLRDLHYRKENYMCFSSATVPYRAYLARVAPLIMSKKFVTQRDKWLKHFNFVVQPKRKVKDEWWSSFYFLEQRYLNWKRYVPEKKLIRELFDEESYDLLWLFLKPYLDQIAFYVKSDLPLVIDEDIWGIVMQLYHLNGYDDYADYLQNLHDIKPLPAIDGPEAQAYLASHAPSSRDALLSLYTK